MSAEEKEAKSLPQRAKGALLHRVRMLAKDALLFHVLPRAYRRAARMPVEEGKVIFLENKEATLPESFEVLYERLSQVSSLKLEFVSLGETRVRLRQYYKNACGAFKKWGMSTADLIFGGSRDEILRHPFYENLSLVTVSSPEVVWAYEEAMVLQDRPGIVRPVGVSRTDVFFDDDYLAESRRKLLEAVPAAADKRVIVYAPTFRGRVAQAEGPAALDIAAMRDAFSADSVLVIKHHPFVRELPPIPADCRDFAFDVTRELPINELLCSADAVISDYSSLVFEYSLFGRPMVFFAYDQDEYADWRGFYYDYDALTPGPVCTTTEGVVSALKAAAEDFDSSEVDAFRERFMSACDGRATDRIIEEVFGDEVLREATRS